MRGSQVQVLLEALIAHYMIKMTVAGADGFSRCGSSFFYSAGGCFAFSWFFKLHTKGEIDMDTDIFEKIKGKMKAAFGMESRNPYTTITVTSIVAVAVITVALLFAWNVLKKDADAKPVAEQSLATKTDIAYETGTYYGAEEAEAETAFRTEADTMATVLLEDITKKQETTQEPTTQEPTTPEPTTQKPATKTAQKPAAETETVALIPIEKIEVMEKDLTDEREQEVRNQAALVPEPVTQNSAPQNSTTAKPSSSVETQNASVSGSSAADVPESAVEPPVVDEYATIVRGIDVSSFQGTIDWKTVKASGISFAIIRVGGRGYEFGSIYSDSKFKENIEGALAAGIPVGVYFFSQAISETEALEEASYVINMIQDYPITYPVVYDWEPGTGFRTEGLSKEMATKAAYTFLNAVQSYGYEAMLYSYHAALGQYFDMSALSGFKTWLAYYFEDYYGTGVEYEVGGALPYEDYPYQMWQYTSTGSVPGIEGNVDLDIAFFSYNNSGVSSDGLVLEPPAKTFTAGLNEDVDIITGLKAYNAAGINVASDVVITIMDASGEFLTLSKAVQAEGEYTITYSLVDFTGASKSVTSILKVVDVTKTGEGTTEASVPVLQTQES